MTAIALLQAAGNSGASSIIASFVPLAIIVVIFYFIVIAPQAKQRRKLEETLKSLKKGDRVITTGGIYGTIQGVDADVVYLKIAENVKVKVARSAITGLLAGEGASE